MCDRNRARVFCAFTSEEMLGKGFYQLSLSLERDSKLKKGDEYDLWKGGAHIIYINYLGVRREVQNNGLGRLLLVDALRRCYHVSESLPVFGVGIRPLNDRNKQSYSKKGFGIPDDEKDSAHPLMILPIWDLKELMT